LKQSEIEADVVAAFDINSVANRCYEHNFPSVKVTRVNIEHLPVEFYEKKAWEGWLMSPPCQPFTRGGKLLDDEDARSTGFLYLVNVLEGMKNPPKYLFIENVLNFEVSRCHDRFISVATRLGYEIHEFLVTPNDEHIGIPNDRLRYYLTAVRKESLIAEPRPYVSNIYRSFGAFFTSHENYSSIRPERLAVSPEISTFLRETPEDSSLFAVPMKYLTDYIDYRHDIVKPSSRRSTTFTKAYGSKHIIGVGSFLQTKHLDLQYSPDDRAVLPTLGLRFFSPREIALIHDFPLGEFEFPPEFTTSQKYRLLGNSMNVRVVGLLFKILFFPDCSSKY
jgi:tRNA (cytosine38-C5)-methyltransferase